MAEVKHTAGPYHLEGACIVDYVGAPVLICCSDHDADPKALLLALNSQPDLLAACVKFWAFYQDLSTSNPGFMGKLTLQDYAQWNEATIELPAAIAKATP